MKHLLFLILILFTSYGFSQDSTNIYTVEITYRGYDDIPNNHEEVLVITDSIPYVCPVVIANQLFIDRRYTIKAKGERKPFYNVYPVITALVEE